MIISLLKKFWFWLFGKSNSSNNSSKVEKALIKSRALKSTNPYASKPIEISKTVSLNPEYHPRRRKLKGWQKENHKFK